MGSENRSGLLGGENLYRALRPRAGGAHESIPPVDRGIFQDLAVSPAGDDLPASGLAEADGHQRVTLNVDHPTHRRCCQTLDTHLLQVDCRATLMRASVIDSPIDQLEDFPAQRDRLPLVGREGAEIGGVPLRAIFRRTAWDGQSHRKYGPASEATPHSMANSRLNTTSKLNVLL